MFCDLHTHSVFSDGTDTPEEIVFRAEALGLGAVALTDHNCVDGLPRFLAAGSASPVKTVPGVEFSTGWLDGELHILALFVREEHYDAIRSLCAGPDQAKRESNLALAKALNDAGYAIDYEAIEAASPNGRINRSQFGDALLRLGYVKTKQEAFDTILRPGGPFYQPPKRLDALETIGFIRSIGAVPVLAHPFQDSNQRRPAARFHHTPAQMEAFLPLAMEAGLEGMETMHSCFDLDTACLADRMAGQFGLLQSGGSDYHGTGKQDVLLGGQYVPMEFYRRLKALSEG
ncbi:MAG: PHP domain-containing protein [Oscillospiraceae bacterium]|nr:PHP domain-containing protein [Oscillospiraceae bacterium]